MKLIESVPNISEGRDSGVIRTCTDAVERIEGVALLDVHTDADHHRSVLTMAGAPRAVVDAVCALAATTLSTIDLRRHQGVHRRIGATDVIPFIPLRGAVMEDCITAARSTALALAKELSIPTFLYGHAATNTDRSWLPHLRGNGFETLEERMQHGLHADFGPKVPHPSAGGTIVGARPFLVAFNVVLDTADLDIARRIAAAVRTSNGGLAGVQAMGVPVRDGAQVSMNLFDLTAIDLQQVFDRVQQLAEENDVPVRTSEIVGLAPRTAFPPSDYRSVLKLKGPGTQILEDRLEEAFPGYEGT